MTAQTATPEDYAAADGDGVAPMHRRMLPLLAAALAGCAATGPVGATPPLAQQPVRVFLSRDPRGPQSIDDPVRIIHVTVSAFLWSAEAPGSPEGRYLIREAGSYPFRVPPGRLLPVDLDARLNARARETAEQVVQEAAARRSRAGAAGPETPYVSETERYERVWRTLSHDPGASVIFHIDFEISDVGARMPVPLGPGEHLLSVIESMQFARANNHAIPYRSFSDVVFVRGTVPQIEAGLLDRAALLTRRALEVLDVPSRL